MSGRVSVVAYVRRSTSRQALSRAAQLAAIRAEAVRRGWVIVAVESDTASGGKARRAGLERAVARVAAEHGLLVAARLDRISRSVVQFGMLLEDARRRGFGLAVLDIEINTTTANGRLVAGVLMQVAQWEREIIGERTAAALAVKAEGGWRPSGRMCEVEEARVRAAVSEAGGNVTAAARALGLHRTSVRRVMERAA